VVRIICLNLICLNLNLMLLCDDALMLSGCQTSAGSSRANQYFLLVTLSNPNIVWRTGDRQMATWRKVSARRSTAIGARTTATERPKEKARDFSRALGTSRAEGMA
jgi:hypothetical protein